MFRVLPGSWHCYGIFFTKLFHAYIAMRVSSTASASGNVACTDLLELVTVLLSGRRAVVTPVPKRADCEEDCVL